MKDNLYLIYFMSKYKIINHKKNIDIFKCNYKIFDI